MIESHFQAQRFELKYRISAATALQVRDFASAHLDYDEHSVGPAGHSYPIHSIYLDSEELLTYWDVMNSNMNRYKIRLRFYDDDPAGPVFLEIKRRVNDAILKQRCAVKREAVPLLLARQLPEPDHLLSSHPKALVALQDFCVLMEDLNAVPRAQVSYLREAWVSSGNNSVRVTLDRDVRVALRRTGEISTQLKDFVMPFAPEVILELKFTERFPTWFRDMAEALQLTQSGNAKYADGIAMIGAENISGA